MERNRTIYEQNKHTRDPKWGIILTVCKLLTYDAFTAVLEGTTLQAQKNFLESKSLINKNLSTLEVFFMPSENDNWAKNQIQILFHVLRQGCQVYGKKDVEASKDILAGLHTYLYPYSVYAMRKLVDFCFSGARKGKWNPDMQAYEESNNEMPTMAELTKFLSKYQKEADNLIENCYTISNL